MVSIGNFMFIAGMILSVIIIVLSGIRWMSTSDPKGARQMLISGIIGSAVIMGVALIIRTVAALVSGQFFN